jgi:hypothetical protein
MYGCGSSRRVQNAVRRGGCRGAKGPRIYALPFGFGKRVRLFRTFSDRVFIRHALSRTQPRHSSGLLENGKCGDAASCQLAAQRRREVDAPSVVNVAQDDPRPSPALI